jgi:methyl-accepting chemotaxis protein
MRTAVASYRAGFADMMSLQRERGWLNAGVIGEMKRASFALQELLGDGKDRTTATLRAELLALVRDQADYLRELDNHKAYLVGERIAILREEIAASAHPRTAELNREVDAFAAAWGRIREIDGRIGIHSGVGLRGALAEAQATVVPLIGTALERARARFEAATATVERAAATARLVSLAAALVAVAIGSFLAVSLGRRLRRSLAAVLAAVEAYARGDRNARVGLLPHRDEFAVLGEAFDRMSETLAEATAELEEINASLELAVKGDTAGLLERVRALVASRKPPG